MLSEVKHLWNYLRSKFRFFAMLIMTFYIGAYQLSIVNYQLVISMRTTVSAIILGCFMANASAQNPIAQTIFSTDPAPMVSGDRLYVFTGHDEEKADFFWMNEWRLFSTNDMVNWQDHGCPLAQCDFKWADDRAWAPQCIERNGKFYLYVPIHANISRGMAIGVAVADRVVGPYRDALGKPL